MTYNYNEFRMTFSFSNSSCVSDIRDKSNLNKIYFRPNLRLLINLYAIQNIFFPKTQSSNISKLMFHEGTQEITR